LFLDQTTLSLAPNTTIVLDRFVFDPDRGTGEIGLQLTEGALRFIGGTLSAGAGRGDPHAHLDHRHSRVLGADPAFQRADHRDLHRGQPAVRGPTDGEARAAPRAPAAW
jgi:hypothetical protein